MLNVPPKFGIISQESKEMIERKKNTPFLKKSPGELLIHPFFYNSDFSKNPFTGQVTRFRPFSEGGGGGMG